MMRLGRIRLFGRRLLRSEDLTLTFVGVTLLYPPLPRFKGNELPDFYSAVCKRHQFDSFSLLGDSGALLETEAERRLKLDREELLYEEHVRNVRNPFPMVRQRATDLVSEAAQTFGLRLYLPQDCTVRALWPVPEGIEDIGEELKDKAFGLRTDQFDHLGNVSGVGMHLTGHRGENDDFGWGLEIAPYLPEDGYLYIEVAAHQHMPMNSADEVGEFIQKTYDFLTNECADFINTFL